MSKSNMNGRMPRRRPDKDSKKGPKKGGFSTPEWENAFEESFKRNEELLRRLAKL